jgi:hypothetical protein
VTQLVGKSVKKEEINFLIRTWAFGHLSFVVGSKL